MDRDSIPSFQAILEAKGQGTHLLIQLQEALNLELSNVRTSTASWPKDSIARHLISQVEELVDRLESFGYVLGRIDYGGDVEPENSEQTYSSCLSPSARLIVHFSGFRCEVEWESGLAT